MLKRVLFVLYKVVFIENEAVLLCVIMRKRAWVFAATIYCITFWYRVCRYKVQFLWCSFQTRFGTGRSHFQKVVLLKWNCFSSCNLSFAMQQMSVLGCKNMFSLVSLSKLKFITSVTLVSFVSYTCRTRVVLVSLLLHSYCLCRTCVALVSLVLHPCLAFVL